MTLSSPHCTRGTRDLAHGDLERVVRVGEVIARGREHTHATPDESENAKLLSDEIAGEPAGVLHDHGAHAIALDPVQQSGKTGSGLDWGSAPPAAFIGRLS
jgi:hypothetical protein